MNPHARDTSASFNLPLVDGDALRLIIQDEPLFPGSSNPQLPAGLCTLSVATSKETILAWGASPIRIGAESLEIYHAKTGDHTPHKISLPPSMEEKLLHILDKGPPHEGWECTSFVRFMNGMDYEISVFDLGLWNTVLCSNPTMLEVGDTILLFDSHENLRHCAIYLGANRFLSQWGEQGGIAVCDVEGMSQAFSAVSWRGLRAKSADDK
jgi:hypothetical protein